jgi:ribosomal protein L11 methyltransferase
VDFFISKRSVNYIKITFAAIHEDVRDILSGLLSQTPLTGIEEEDGEFRVYYEEPVFPSSEISTLAEKLDLHYEQETIVEQNWNARWEEHFQPVLIADFCSIRAHFHPEVKNVEHDLIITPKMSFGTGHHATTEMMVRLMKELDFREKKVLDFGTGTGVLAILAEKLGAAEVVAIDYDNWSVENAIENSIENQCRHIRVLKGSLETVQNMEVDILLANINRSVLMQYMADFPGHLSRSGYLLLSGILAEEDVDGVRHAAEQAGFQWRNQRIKNNWAAILFQK